MAQHATPEEVAEALKRAFCHGKRVLVCRIDGEFQWRVQGQKFAPLYDPFFNLIAARFDMLFCGDIEDAVTQGTAVIGHKVVYRSTIIQALELIVPS